MKILYLLCATIIATNSYFYAGTVVLLRGTACAGKTSLLKALAEQSNWYTIEDDQYFYDSMPKAWKSGFPKEFELIENVISPENILQAILWGNPLFKENATDDEKTVALDAIKNIRRVSDYPEFKERNSISKEIKPRYHDEIKTALNADKNIIIDSWWQSPADFEQYHEEGHKIITVIGYCPLKEAFNRLVARNAQAKKERDNTNRRYVRQLLCSFYHDFKPASWEDKVLDTITREQLDEIFEIAQDMITQHSGAFDNYGLFSRCELSIEAFHALKANLIEKFWFDKQETINITYSSPFDAILRLDQMSPEEAADMLINNILPAHL